MARKKTQKNPPRLRSVASPPKALRASEKTSKPVATSAWTHRWRRIRSQNMPVLSLKSQRREQVKDQPALVLAEETKGCARPTMTCRTTSKFGILESILNMAFHLVTAIMLGFVLAVMVVFRKKEAEKLLEPTLF